MRLIPWTLQSGSEQVQAYNLRVALTRLPGRRYKAYSLRVALTRLIYLLYISLFSRVPLVHSIMLPPVSLIQIRVLLSSFPVKNKLFATALEGP
jgi:hypothetical protein